MLITKVKVGKVTNLSEARYCAGMGVDFLSFPISSVDPKTYQEITGWVAGPMFGIEVENENLEKISEYKSDFIQVKAKIIDQVKTEQKLIVTLTESDWLKEKTKLIAAKDRILLLELIIDSTTANTQSIIADVSKEFPVLIQAPHLAELEQLLKLPIQGISLEGSSETRVGLKEYPLSEILEQLEERD